MEIVLRVKHWQLFLAVVVLIVIRIIGVALSAHWGFVIIDIGEGLIGITWLLMLGYELNQRLPPCNSYAVFSLSFFS